MKWQWCRTKERAIIYRQGPGKGVGLRTFLWGITWFSGKRRGISRQRDYRIDRQWIANGGDRTNFKELYGRSGKFYRDTAKILQTLLTPYPSPPPPRAKNDCSLMQINVSYATFTDISSINLNSLPLIRVVRIVKKELFLSYKTS